MKNKLLINSNWENGLNQKKIFSPSTLKEISSIELANEKQIIRAISSASNCFYEFKNTSRYIRSKLLEKFSIEIEIHKNEFIKRIIDEAGKPYLLATAEVNRAIISFKIAAEETKRYSGENIPMDTESHTLNFLNSYTYLVPRGVILAITPFNFPLNLVAHKLAPALAIGSPIILKPAPQTPGTVSLLGEIFLDIIKTFKEEKIPASAFQILHCENELTEKIIQSPKIQTISFTGSANVGWQIQKLANKKKVCLELGGNASVIIHHTNRDSMNMNKIIESIIFGAFSYSGQICISIQNAYIHESIYDSFLKSLLQLVKNLKPKNPNDKKTILSSVINEDAKNRILSWVSEAKDLGAKILIGGNSKLNFLDAIILTNVNEKAKLFQEEVFGPVLLIHKYNDLKTAVDKINSSKFGLQTGVFTDSISIKNYCIKNIESGSILINEVPSFRADHLPYGGIKESGLGREGIK